MKRPIKSSVVVARLLESEGFTAHAANEVIRYSRRITHPSVQRRYERNSRAAKEALRGLDEGTKAIVGKFINHQMRIAFDAGLRIGLTAHAVLNDKECDGIPHERGPQQELQDSPTQVPAVEETHCQGREEARVEAKAEAEARKTEAI